MKITHLSLIMSLFVLCSFGKTFAQEVISTSGNYGENSSNSISWSIGEPVIETFSSSGNIITQGVHQSLLTITKVEELISSNFNVQIFPNPTNEFVILKTDKYKDMSFQLYSFDGKLLQEANIIKEESKIKFTNCSAGVYFIKIIKEKKIYNNYQIVKQK